MMKMDMKAVLSTTIREAWAVSASVAMLIESASRQPRGVAGTLLTLFFTYM